MTKLIIVGQHKLKIVGPTGRPLTWLHELPVTLRTQDVHEARALFSRHHFRFEDGPTVLTDVVTGELRTQWPGHPETFDECCSQLLAAGYTIQNDPALHFFFSDNEYEYWMGKSVREACWRQVLAMKDWGSAEHKIVLSVIDGHMTWRAV